MFCVCILLLVLFFGVFFCVCDDFLFCMCCDLCVVLCVLLFDGDFLF